MKIIIKIVLIVLVSKFLSSSLKAQPYYALPDSNVYWHITTFGFTGDPIFTEIQFVNCDTLINNISYKKLYRQHFSVDTTLSYIAAINEDTINRKIYFVLPDDTTEWLLYDFSANIGDTINIHNWEQAYYFGDTVGVFREVISIDYIEIENSCRKRLEFVHNGIPEYWIEGIGSTFGFLYPAIFGIDYHHGLFCMIHNSDTIYYYLDDFLDSYICCYPGSPQPIANFLINTIDINRVYFINMSDSACSYKWFFGDGDSSLVENPLHIYQDTGMYNVMLIAYLADKSDTIIIQVEITQIPDCSSFSCSITCFQKIKCNGDTNGKLVANWPGGVSPYTYLWSYGQTTLFASHLSAGNYSLTVTDFYGCIDSNSITLTEPLALNIAVISIDSIQSDNYTINISVSGGTEPYNYLWSNGSTTQDIYNIPVGIYTVEVTDSLGCIDYLTIDVPNSITEVNFKSKVEIYPNPNTGEFTLEILTINEVNELQIKINNIIGQEIYYEKLNKFKGVYYKKIDLKGYAKGIYKLQIKTDYGVVNKKIVIE